MRGAARTNRSRGRSGGIFLPIAAGLAALLLVAGCAERRSPQEPRIAGHPSEFNEISSADFHGARVRERGPSACTTCHGEDLAGDPGTSGCSDCHDGPGGHPRNWVRADAARFHGTAVRNEGLAICRDCHGADLLGGWSGVSCSACHAGGPGGHPAGWTDPSSLAFHGRRALVEGVVGCAGCHGFPPASGTSGVSCADCHG
ncbi:MAG: hypothetical protein FJY73_11185 [Candidatus Eisenbacteria bacterium]|nr:hypothetical protein [Candidatus Eisenbacteria bacterium]